MVNTELLNQYIKSSGYKVSHICSTLGVSADAFNKKRRNILSFTSSEADKLRILLGIGRDAVNVFFSL